MVNVPKKQPPMQALRALQRIGEAWKSMIELVTLPSPSPSVHRVFYGWLLCEDSKILGDHNFIMNWSFKYFLEPFQFL